MYSGQEKTPNGPAIGDEVSLDIPNISNELVVSGHLGKKHEEGWDTNVFRVQWYGLQAYERAGKPRFKRQIRETLDRNFRTAISKGFFF